MKHDANKRMRSEPHANTPQWDHIQVKHASETEIFVVAWQLDLVWLTSKQDRWATEVATRTHNLEERRNAAVGFSFPLSQASCKLIVLYLSLITHSQTLHCFLLMKLGVWLRQTHSDVWLQLHRFLHLSLEQWNIYCTGEKKESWIPEWRRKSSSFSTLSLSLFQSKNKFDF